MKTFIVLEIATFKSLGSFQIFFLCHFPSFISFGGSSAPLHSLAALGAFFLCEFSSTSEFGLTHPMGGKTLSKTKRSDKTLKRSQEMCDQNSPTPAETIWKLCWKGQLLTHCARKSLKTCGQRSDLPV